MNALSENTLRSREKNLIRDARLIVHDLFDVQPAIYWLDFTLSATVAYSAAAMFVNSGWNSWLTWLCFPIAVAMLYRISMFVHESIHFRSGQMRGFRMFWDLTAGIPMLMPTSSYESHLSHHNTAAYGTIKDAEYLPLARGGLTGVFAFLLQILFQPLLVFLRYLVGTPISFLHPTWRRWLNRHASSLVINFRYQPDDHNQKLTASQVAIEWGCFLRAASLILVVVAGFDSPDRLLKIYLLAMAALTLNHIRTLAAHRYQSDGDPMSHADQFLDSTNITGGWLTEIICPVGLRYHALHHLFPSIPYYHLGTAHRRLISQLPAGSIYFQNIYPTVSAALLDFFRLVIRGK